MKRKLFEISDDIVAAKTDLFASDEEIEERLKILLNELVYKEDGVWMLYDKLQDDINLADNYIEKIKKQKIIRQNSQKQIKSIVIDSYRATDELPKCSEFNPLKILQSAAVDVIDEKKIPEEYWKEKTVVVLDKRKMLEHLKTGRKIPGADLKHSDHVRGLK